MHTIKARIALAAAGIGAVAVASQTGLAAVLATVGMT